MKTKGIYSTARIVVALASIATLFFTYLNVAKATVLSSERIATGLTRPLFLASPPGDTSRLFILEQYTAQIKIIKKGAVLTTPFLDIGNLVIDSGSERGLLGLAFHPDYSNNGYFYVNYTNNASDTVIARFSVSDNPDLADPDSIFIILTIPQPYANHNGGMLAFGPLDGYLYIGMGDGGSAGDPENRAQNDGTLLGKMLRIDVDAASPYGIPPDNPYVGAGDPLDEIWAKGLRNPWRFSFDRSSGDLYIADVGQNNYEEIDFQIAADAGGNNYGWRLMEGTHCYNPPTDCDPGTFTYPIYEYTHGGSPFRCSITGGYVYRGNAIPELQGTYCFADFCSGQIWSFRYDGSTLTEFSERTAELNPGAGLSINQIASFGEDGSGELYIVDLDGEVYKICPEEGCCGICESDINCDTKVDLTDLVTLKGEFLLACPPSPCNADFNSDGKVDLSDLVIMKGEFLQSDCCPCL